MSDASNSGPTVGIPGRKTPTAAKPTKPTPSAARNFCRSDIFSFGGGRSGSALVDGVAGWFIFCKARIDSAEVVIAGDDPPSWLTDILAGLQQRQMSRLGASHGFSELRNRG